MNKKLWFILIGLAIGTPMYIFQTIPWFLAASIYALIGGVYFLMKNIHKNKNVLKKEVKETTEEAELIVFKINKDEFDRLQAEGISKS